MPESSPSGGAPDTGSTAPTMSGAGALPPEAIALAGRIFDAARTGQMDIFHQALPVGLSPNMTNEKGDTLLMLSSYHGHDELVSLLLSFGADPNALNDRGQSPLAGAVYKNEEAVIEALLKGGADPDWGGPTAMEALRLFKLEDKWGSKFETAEGRGKMASKN